MIQFPNKSILPVLNHTLGKLLDSDWLRDCEYKLRANSVIQGKLQISWANSVIQGKLQISRAKSVIHSERKFKKELTIMN